jgi:hypothetical protein
MVFDLDFGDDTETNSPLKKYNNEPFPLMNQSNSNIFTCTHLIIVLLNDISLVSLK